jgi:flagellar motor switch protein FliN/FliY
MDAEDAIVEERGGEPAGGEPAPAAGGGESAAAGPVPAVVAVEEEVSLQPLGGEAGGEVGGDADLTRVLDVPVELTVEMGRTTMTIRETLSLSAGSIITLDRLVGEPVDLYANGRLIARGEVIAVDEEYGLRVTEVLGRTGQQAA